MAKLSWHPWMTADDLREAVDQLVGESLAATGGRRPGGCGYLWKPAADVYETERDLVIQIELPGFAIEDVNIEIRDDRLWVYGERRFERDAEAGGFLALERCYGPFARQFVLAGAIDRDRIAATLKHGLLTLVVPKEKRPEPRRIRIETT